MATQFHPEVTPSIVARWGGQATDTELKTDGIDLPSLLAETAACGPDAVRRAHALVDWFCDEVVPS